MWREALLDSGAISHFTKPSDDLSITGTSDKTVIVANGDQCQTTSTSQDPLPQWHDGAWIAHMPRRLIVESKPEPAIQLTTSKSIASRVKERRQSQPSKASIAESIARRCHEAAKPVLDQDTGDLLEY